YVDFSLKEFITVKNINIDGLTHLERLCSEIIKAGDQIPQFIALNRIVVLCSFYVIKEGDMLFIRIKNCFLVTPVFTFLLFYPEIHRYSIDDHAFGVIIDFVKCRNSRCRMHLAFYY